MNTPNYNEDKARAEYEYEFGAQDAAAYEGYEQEERRDYHAEAKAIAAGTSLMLAEKAHVIALAEYIAAIEADLNYLRRQNQTLRNGHPAFIAARKPAGKITITKEEVA